MISKLHGRAQLILSQIMTFWKVENDDRSRISDASSSDSDCTIDNSMLEIPHDFSGDEDDDYSNDSDCMIDDSIPEIPDDYEGFLCIRGIIRHR